MSVAFALGKIRALKLELARLDPRAGMPVLPPLGASPVAVAAVERKLGRALPREYREMLALHDGFPQLYQGASLLSTAQLLRGTFVDLARLVIDLGDGRPVEANRRCSSLVPFGIDNRAETIFAFDPDATGTGNGLGVLIWMNEIGLRLEGFAPFLDFVTEMLVADVEDRRRTLVPPAPRRATAPWPLAGNRVRDRSTPGAHAA